MPDTALIKQMSKDFNISLEDMFEGRVNKSLNKTLTIKILVTFIIIIIFLLLIIIQRNNLDFELKKLSTTCKDFDISGSIAYNKNKTAIYITDITYCGLETDQKYEEIECVLYESSQNIDTKISSYKYSKNKDITLEDFLEKVTLSVDSHKHTKTCKTYDDGTLFLSIIATDKNKNITAYKIPLTLENTCKK